MFNARMLYLAFFLRLRRQAFRDRRYPRTIWPKVPYFFDESARAKAWNDDTCIEIFEETSGIEWLCLQGSSIGCWSFVGRIGGVQNLSLGNGCESVSIAAHELGDALGFFHTHSRYDREQFITVNVQNIKFSHGTTITDYNYEATYDPGSVIQWYGPTMVPQDVTYTETLGSPFISFYDFIMLNRHYGCTVISTERPERENCQKCICPSGYGGALSSATIQTFKDTVGNRSLGTVPRGDFDKCHYWLTVWCLSCRLLSTHVFAIDKFKAPEGKKIEVKLSHFSPKGIAVDGCTYAGVEIKTNRDQRLTGYKYAKLQTKGDTKLKRIFSKKLRFSGFVL
ncbi:unnamed protein product [Heligmosomoides polygyrus]|uniref:Metalloendopeptidase n=1 Tax=Heligmosomoides polygyrus TaxID=6339 RepID=A0A183FXF8_HELPZ|nr:unnamed protein product [Heligmosomoides polygyrus]